MSTKTDPYADLMAGIAKVMAEPTLPNAADRLCWLSGYVQHEHPELSRALRGLADEAPAEEPWPMRRNRASRSTISEV